MWTLIPWLVIAVLYGFCWSWDYGLRKGRAEHAQCHHALRAIVDREMVAVREAEDIKAWEEEL